MGGADADYPFISIAVELPYQILPFRIVHFIHGENHSVSVGAKRFEKVQVLGGHLGAIHHEDDRIALPQQ